jgi:hypothetical protein
MNEGNNPSEYSVSALYSDGLHFNQNKDKFNDLPLFLMIENHIYSSIMLEIPKHNGTS